jgi:ParB family transcriptional regulator, chromosome partitioning protein
MKINMLIQKSEGRSKEQARSQKSRGTMTTTTAEKTTVAEKPAAAVAAVDKPVIAPDKRRALGRGLESLLPGGPRVVAGTAAGAAAAGTTEVAIGDLQAQAARVAAGETILHISLDAIDQNPYQTRCLTRESTSEDGIDSLHELAESIRANGVIQPITVRAGKDGRYVLITGERRWKASRLAGKNNIAAIVRQVSEQQAAEMTVIENLQREDLNCVDQAHAFVMLSQQFKLTQEQIGQRIGVSRETISNYMRLVKLPTDVLRFLQEGQLNFSHARVLLNLLDLTQASKVAERAVKQHLSVEQLEDVVFEVNVPLRKNQEEQTGRARWVDPNVRATQQELERILGVRVRIRDRRGRGKIVIEYATLEDFDRVLEMLKGAKK